MIEKVKKALLDLTSAVQARKLYSKDHPKYNEIIDKAYAEIKDILTTQKEFIVGIINEELAWENEILFDVSRKIKSLLLYFRDKNIEKIQFSLPLEKWELEKFITYLSVSQKEEAGNIQEYLKRNQVINIDAGKIRAAADQKTGIRPHTSEGDPFKNTFQNSADLIKETVNQILSQEDIDYLDLRFNILTLIEYYTGNHNELMDLISVKKKDLLTFIHMLNTSILSMFFASQLGLSSDRVIDIGISALFHDIGKIAQSKGILKKKGKLSDKEFTKMKDHSVVGSRILLQYKKNLGILPSVVAFEHHLKYDNGGYPKLKYPMEPHLASQIIFLCDVYDALYQKRAYKKHFPPMKIFEIMTKEKNRMFDPELVDRFFEIMGVWPLGTLVQLNDRRVGYVKKINRNDKYRPVIKVISPQSRSGQLDLSKEDQTTKIIKSLDPLKEGKKYADLMSAEQG
ncbi:MAG: HD domain-containing protein [Candidatus Aminicenantes bacterium]|nr:HD domain-containing protein [Candidatus Aminicenantes bacterium]